MREHRFFRRLAALAAGVAMLATGGIVTATANAAETEPRAGSDTSSCVWGETAAGLPKVCWLDMSGFQGQTGWNGKAVNGTMDVNIGNGYKLSFDTKTTGRKVEASTVPTWIDKETGELKSWFGREGYKGFGDAKLALYQPTVNRWSKQNTTTIELTNISLTYNGQKVTGDWSLVMGDGESSNESEAIAYKAKPSQVSECTTLPTSSKFECDLQEDNGWMVAHGDDKSGSVNGVPYTTIAKAKTPTSVSVQLRASSYSSRQAIVFGVQFVTATAKRITDADYTNPVPGVKANATVSADGFGSVVAKDGDAVLPIIASDKQVKATYGLEAANEASKDFAKWYQICYADNNGQAQCDDKYDKPVTLDADSNASHTRKFTLKGITPTLNGVKNLTVTPDGSQLAESQRIDRTFRFNIKRTDSNGAQVKYTTSDKKTSGDINSDDTLTGAAEATVEKDKTSADIKLPKLFFQRDSKQKLTYTFDIIEQESDYDGVTTDTAKHTLTVNVDTDGSVTYSTKNDDTEQTNGKIEFNNTIEARSKIDVTFINPTVYDGTNPVETREYWSGEEFGALPDVSKLTAPEGKVFDHWAVYTYDGKKPTGTKAVDSSDKVTKDYWGENNPHYVYALFKDAPAPENANVNFIDTLDNGQTGNIIGTRTYKVNTTLSEWPTDLQMPVHEGYEFVGWSLNKDDKTTIAPGDVTVPAEGVNLYAVWKRQAPQPVSKVTIVYFDQDAKDPFKTADYKAGDAIADEQGGWAEKPDARKDSRFLGYRYRVEGNVNEPLAKPSEKGGPADENGNVTEDFANAHNGAKLMLEAVWQKAEPAKANAGDSLKVVKKLTGDMTTRAFEFVLKDQNGTQVATTGRQDVTTGEEKSFPLEGTLEFTSSGEHKYTLSEVEDGQPGVSYDRNTYTVTYNVKYDAASNKLEVAGDPTITDKDGKPVEAPVPFNNGYDASAATLDLTNALKGTKTLKGDPWQGEFVFGLYETEDGHTASEPLDTANVDASTDGKPEGGVFAWHFDKTLTFDEPGVHEYVVKEHNDGVEGMDYDNTQYKVVVNVVNNDKTGGLVPQVTIEKDGVKVDSLDFTNTYAEPAVPPTPDPDPDPSPEPDPSPDPDPTPVPPACSEPFVDVDETTPHYAEIEWVYCNRIAEGWKEADGTITYRPRNEVTRQDYAAFLYRLAGRPDYTPSASDFRFSDVTRFTPHYKEILWAASHGYITGFEDGTFRGMASIQRQDAVQMLWRLAGSPEPKDVSDNFTDVALTPFKQALAWAKETGVSVGFPNPDGTASFGVGKTIIRQDMAFFLKNAKATLG